MSLQLALVISLCVHLAFILIFPTIETPKIIHIPLPIELIPYTPPIEKPKSEVAKPKPETIRTEKIKTKKIEKKETIQVKKEPEEPLPEPKEPLPEPKEPPPEPKEPPPEPKGTPIEPKRIPLPLRSTPAVSIKTAEFPFTYYLAHIKKRVAENWFIKGYRGHYTTIVYFKIHRDGRVSDIKIRKSSGDFSFDRLAITAIESAAPFLPLPDAYPESSLGVHFEFQLRE